MIEYRQKIYTVAGEKHIHPALIATIISRESRAGEAIKKTEGRGDWNPVKKKYNAFGLMQVDVDEDGGNHIPEGKWDSVDHLRQATDILIYFIERIQKKCKNWSKEEQLKGGIAAYNVGDELVDRDYPDKVDENTTQ
ncbi:hypothetical protein INR49_011429 [Caranx melampygus]|nr:hypothetical protein INR49_011429 [Caranx melampygus]